jgi:FkbM family methyltransferase
MVKQALRDFIRRFGYDVRQYPALLETNLTHSQVSDAWVKRLRAEGPIRTVLDVGANAGGTARLFRSAFPGSTVHAFEPSASTLARLREAVAQDPAIRVHPVAVGATDGTVTLNVNAFDGTNSVLASAPGIGRYAPAALCELVQTEQVPMVRLDTFCSREGLQTVDLLKVDVQGFELDVLKGCGAMLSPRRMRGLFLELLFVPAYEQQTWADDVMAFVRGKGYRLFGFTNVGFDEVSGWKWADAMFVGE